MRIICRGLKDEDFPVVFCDHKISLGRDASNSIVVPAEDISSCHAVLTEEENGLFVQDNESRSGTFLNRNRIRSKQKLADGDVIQIGDRMIQVVFSPDQNVVLNFASSEQVKTVPMGGAAAAPGSPSSGQAASSGNDAERTVAVSETQDSTIVIKDPFSSGSEIGKYVIVKRLGKGGMGEVYLARHKTLGILRALKVLSKAPGKDNSVLFERFIREARLALEIHHPNVVGVVDVETDSSSGYPYIVMEYIDGGSLRDTLRTGKKLSEEQAVVIVEAIASALQTAEEHNIVHRDIKPDNIMFTTRGEVKLADLGIAKSRGTDISLTQTNVMIGTPAYLPPEQARNAKGVDGRADIYSLGATYYEMLTGEPPYPGEDTIEILHKLLLSPVPDPRKSNPDVSPASASIIMKMLAKSPKDRFQNAKELLDTMERAFPSHSPNESCDVVRNVLAGDRQNNAEFSSAISSTRFRFRFPLPRRKLVLLACAAVFICCFAGIIAWFIYELFVKESPDAEAVGANQPHSTIMGRFFGTTMYNACIVGSDDTTAEAANVGYGDKLGGDFAMDRDEDERKTELEDAQE